MRCRYRDARWLRRVSFVDAAGTGYDREHNSKRFTVFNACGQCAWACMPRFKVVSVTL
ncbi:hypothetical protein HMPREF1324_1257 [Rothia aeria F0474]|uniref:Uncharacterized protein n=1 Tax=Rothia aeria F0474 TaxID=1125724 RepID=I0UUA2_9MICC|nr:hypothetical protein HMPREF1324_1257 [Rothia aeria F0474]